MWWVVNQSGTRINDRYCAYRFFFGCFANCWHSFANAYSSVTVLLPRSRERLLTYKRALEDLDPETVSIKRSWRFWGSPACSWCCRYPTIGWNPSRATSSSLTCFEKEAIGLLRLLSKTRQIQERRNCQSNPSRLWGSWDTNITGIVRNKFSGIEEGFPDTGWWGLLYFLSSRTESHLLKCNSK